MALDSTDIRKIAHLARLGLDDPEIEAARVGLSRILAMIGEMNAVATDSVEPLYHPQEGRLRLRPDVADPAIDRDDLQACAPRHEGGLYLVPRVVE